MNDLATYSGTRDRAYKQPNELSVLGHLWRICHLHATPGPLIATILIFLRGYSEGKTRCFFAPVNSWAAQREKGRGRSRLSLQAIAPIRPRMQVRDCQRQDVAVVEYVLKELDAILGRQSAGLLDQRLALFLIPA
jgi:hypothetical protein